MKCKACNGTGKIKVIDFAKPNWKDTEKVCPICCASGVVEQNSENDNDVDVVRAFIGKVSTESAKEAIRIADELADMIIFHAKVIVNAKTMSQPWEI